MKKFLYLIKVNINLKLIFIYFRHIFFLKFNKNLRKKIIKDYRIFLKKKNITQDWFSHNTFDWYLEKKYFLGKRNYLEIGSFEGISAMYVLKEFPNISVTCVDAWSKTTDGNEVFNLKTVEKNFDYNTQKFNRRIKKIKKLSSNFFISNKNKYDVIYIDGSHKADDVFEDCKNAWIFLKADGLLILDDFFWKKYNDINENVAYGIKKFLKTIDSYKIIKLTKYQLFIKKINNEKKYH